LTKINELDSKILHDLLLDGRKSFAALAREFGTTKNKVWKHYRSLVKKGIVTGATTQMDFASFGYETIATLLISVEAQQIDQATEFIGKIIEVLAFRQYYSFYNIRAFVSLRSLNELDQVKQAIKRKLPNAFLKTYVWTDVRNIPENLDLPRIMSMKNQNKPSFLEKLDNKLLENHMDDVDKQILEKLTINGRASFTKIAKEIGTSTDTIVKRYHKLREKGAIRVSIQINPKKIGYNSLLDFNIAFTALEGSPETVIESLARIPDVVIITKTSGDYDLQLTALAKDTVQSFAIQDKISKTLGVTKMEVSARRIPEKWPTPRQCISSF